MEELPQVVKIRPEHELLLPAEDEVRHDVKVRDQSTRAEMLEVNVIGGSRQ